MTLPTTADLLGGAEDQLFNSIWANSERVLHKLTICQSTLGIYLLLSKIYHHLRPQKHTKELIPKLRVLNNKDYRSYVV